MQKELKAKLILFLVISLNIFLNVYGNNWGLPTRWHADEKVTNVLHMANEKTLIDPIGEYLHPTGYLLFLLVFFIPAYGYLKLINYPIENLREVASISWIHMAKLFPDFATGIYIYARTLSAFLGALTVYFIYLLGKELYDENAGLFSAASLSVCMGSVGVNHFAKYSSLVNLLVVLTILLCLRAIKIDSIKSSKVNLFFGFLSGGFAASVHVNAILLLVPLSLTFIYLKSSLFKVDKRPVLLFTGFIFVYLLGIIIGTPTFLTNFADYFSRFKDLYWSSSINKTATERMPVFVGPLNYFFEILSIYGIPLFVLGMIGMTRLLLFWNKISRKEIIVFSFVCLYYLIIAVFLEDRYPHTKHIIAIVALLATFCGKIMADIFIAKRISKFSKYLFFSLVFLYSFAYALKADIYFINGDTRYKSTQWIIENVPKGSRVEVFDQLNYVASTDIMYDYEIIYLGRSSKDFHGERFFKWDTVKNREEHLKRINRYDSTADYIILDLDDINALYSLNFMEHIPGIAEYLKSLFEGKKSFRIVKVFKPTNQMVKSKNIKGLVYHRNLWWEPVPSYSETAITIYIFKRIADIDAKG